MNCIEIRLIFSDSNDWFGFYSNLLLLTQESEKSKKREQQRQSLSENQDSESNNANESQELNEDDVVESWEDIQVVIN